jgi:hypothetical protein
MRVLFNRERLVFPPVPALVIAAMIRMVLASVLPQVLLPQKMPSSTKAVILLDCLLAPSAICTPFALMSFKKAISLQWSLAMPLDFLKAGENRRMASFCGL